MDILCSTPQLTHLNLQLNGRSLHATSRVLGPGSGELEAASKRVTQLSKDPGNEAKLKLYALYKQV